MGRRHHESSQLVVIMAFRGGTERLQKWGHFMWKWHCRVTESKDLQLLGLRKTEGEGSCSWPQRSVLQLIKREIFERVIQDDQRKPFEVPCSGFYAPEAAKYPLTCPALPSHQVLDSIVFKCNMVTFYPLKELLWNWSTHHSPCTRPWHWTLDPWVYWEVWGALGGEAGEADVPVEEAGHAWEWPSAWVLCIKAPGYLRWWTACTLWQVVGESIKK